jgi:hypothetical protein
MKLIGIVQLKSRFLNRNAASAHSLDDYDLNGALAKDLVSFVSHRFAQKKTQIFTDFFLNRNVALAHFWEDYYPIEALAK